MTQTIVEMIDERNGLIDELEHASSESDKAHLHSLINGIECCISQRSTSYK